SATRHSFALALKTNAAPACLLAVLLFVLLALPFGGNIYQHITSMSPHPVYKYIFTEDSNILEVFGSIAACACASAFLMFSFLFSKSRINVYLSLGITREKLFWSRYLAGAALLALPVVLATTVMLGLNLAQFGASSQLAAVYLYYTLGLLTLAFVCYSVASLALVLAGTAVEGIGLAGILLGGVSLVMLAVNNLMKVFLFGDAYDVRSELGNLSGTTNAIIYHTKLWNPLLFFYSDYVNYSTCEVKTATYTDVTTPSFPINPLAVVLWLLLALIVSVAALNCFKRRRAEIGGVGGTNRFLNFVCTLIPSFFIFSIAVLEVGQKLGTPATLVISVLAAAVAYAVCDLILKQQFSALRKGIIKLPVQLALCLIVVAALAAGGLGYSSRLPAAADVKSVYFSYNGTPDNISYSYSGSWGFGDFAYPYYEFAVSPDSMQYTDQDDIARVIALHKSLLDYGEKAYDSSGKGAGDPKAAVRSEIIINYTLKDGRKMVRYYKGTSAENLIAMLSLDSTQVVKSQIENTFSNLASKIGATDEEQTKFYISDSLISNAVQYKGDSAAQQKLLDALKADLLAQTVRNRYFPDTTGLGVIAVGPGYVSQDNAYSKPADIVQSNDLSMKKFFVTPAFTNTIRFLKENGLYQTFEAKAEVTKLTIIPYRVNLPDSRVQSLYFRYMGRYPTNGGRQITDNSQISEILPKLKTNYYTAEGGYMVGATLKSGKTTWLFLPYTDAPESVRKMFG
ncbi:MAG: hypothetical protein P4L75_07070, partial [Clostridia bacterium]|nr:hypothetical protein [Clostridia bacterium]